MSLLKTAAKDGRFLIFAFMEERKNPTESAAMDGSLLIFAFMKERKNPTESAAVDARFLNFALTDERAHQRSAMRSRQACARARMPATSMSTSSRAANFRRPATHTSLTWWRPAA